MDSNFEKFRINYLKNERESVQKKTFTKWINFVLKSGPKIEELFTDLRNGIVLLKLLENVSNEKLGGCSRGKMRIHYIENVNKSLAFLHTKIYLESIGAEDIVDGNPKLTLGLIWTIITRFQIQDSVHLMKKEIAKLDKQISLEENLDQNKIEESNSFEDLNSPFQDPDENFFTCEDDFEDSNSDCSSNLAEEIEKSDDENYLIELPDTKTLLLWCQRKIKDYPVKIDNLTDSWRNGMAFNALVHVYTKNFDFDSLNSENHAENLKHAFEKAFTELGMPKLLDIEDVDTSKPDEKAIVTYLSTFFTCVNK